MADKKHVRQVKDVQAQSKVEQILINDMEISAKTDALLAETRQMNASIVNALDGIARTSRASERAGAQGEAVYAAITEEIKALKRELRYMAIQSASIFEGLTEKITELRAILDKMKTQPAQNAVVQSAAPQIDYDVIAEKVAERTPVKTAAAAEPINYDVLAEKVAERTAGRAPSYPATYPVTYQSEANIDYDVLSDKIISRMPALQTAQKEGGATVVAAAAPEMDYDLLARKVAAIIPAVTARGGDIVVNTDEIADKIIERIPVPESISPDYLANRVAEQIVIPKSGGDLEVDYNALAAAVAARLNIPAAKAEIDGDYVARQVSDRINVGGLDNEAIAKKVAEYLVNRPAADGAPVAEGDPQTVSININVSGLDNEYIADRVVENFIVPDYQEIMFDYDYLAAKIAEKTGIAATEKTDAPVTVAPSAVPVDYNINEGELADAIALRVGSLKAEDFEILVDDEGCTSLSKEICKRFDYELIANAVADKLREVFIEDDAEETDYEEMAARISEKITVAGINEDAIAEKAAAVLSNYLPDFDTDDIADKVAEQVISAMPALDGDALTQSITEKLIESQQDNDYEIVLDEDGLDKVSDSVSVKVIDSTDEKFAAIDKEISEIKELLDGYGNKESEEVTAVEAADEISDDRYGELRGDIAEIKEILDNAFSYQAETEETESAEAEDGEQTAEELTDDRYEELRNDIAEIKEILSGDEVLVHHADDGIDDEKYNELVNQINEIKELLSEKESVEAEDEEETVEELTDDRYEELRSDIAEIKEILSGDEVLVHHADDGVDDEKYNELVNQINEIKELLSEKESEQPADERLDAIDREITEIKELLLGGLLIAQNKEVEEETAFTEPYVVEETLVTVSDLIGGTTIEEEVEEEPVEEVVEEVEEEPVEEVVEEVEEEPVEEVVEEVEEQPVEEAVEEVEEEPVEEVVEEVEEEPVEEVIEEVEEEPIEETVEEQPVEEVDAEETEEVEDESEEELSEEELSEEELILAAGGVDFANMMRYNRSFIARIIQSTDDQKKYYGEVRNALLSYRKVNSNIAWGAERFHKGRETIARFKIRGKTLVLYLALDPATHEFSVYHHKDVSDNKSVAGTPMMIKIKSPRGVKKAIRLIDEMLAARDGVKRNVPERDYAAMYPYETMEELIEDGLVKDVKRNKFNADWK